MAFDRRKMQALLHKQKNDIEGPPLPPEMIRARNKINPQAALTTLIAMGILGASSLRPNRF